MLSGHWQSHKKKALQRQCLTFRTAEGKCIPRGSDATQRWLEAQVISRCSIEESSAAAVPDLKVACGLMQVDASHAQGGCLTFRMADGEGMAGGADVKGSHNVPTCPLG